MSRPRRTSARRVPPAYLAGWLFADLLLVLTLIVLGSQVVPQHAASAAPVLTASPSASASPSPSPSASPKRLGLNPDSKSLRYKVDPQAIEAGDVAALKTDVLSDIRNQFPGQSTALVIVWGTGSDTSSSGEGSALAGVVAPLLSGWDPAFFPPYSPNIIRAYWDGKGKRDTVRVELFFLQQ